jgi:protein ImuA
MQRSLLFEDAPHALSTDDRPPDSDPASDLDSGCIETALASSASPEALAALHTKIARLARSTAQTPWGVLPFGDARVDARFPQGGLPLGRWHEIVGDGLERELPAAGAGFAASLARKIMGREGVVVWVLRCDDLHAPGLPGFGVDPGRLIFVHADKDAEVLNAMEAALRTRGVAAVVGEAEAIDLTAGKRLQLACEQGGATGFLIRRRIFGATRRSGERRAEGSAATTRWRIFSSPSEPDEPGLGPPRWAARLERCRGGRPGSWIMEASDETGDVRVVAELADHAVEAGDGRGAAGARPKPCDSGPRDHDDAGQRAASGGG